MQFKESLSKEELRRDGDPLSYTCHAIERIRTMATTIMDNSYNLNAPPFETYRPGEVRAIGEIIDNAVADIEYLVGIADDKANDMFHENKRLKAEIYELKY